MSRRRTTAAAVVTLTFAAIGVGSIAYAVDDAGGAPQGPPAAAVTGHPAAAVRPAHHSRRPQGPVMSRSIPVRLDIPSVGIDTSLLRLGLNADGTLQVPWKPLLAGWYKHSPTPGQRGPAIIAGHVDSWATGPAVFYRLGEVTVGARVLVTRADHSVAQFKVTAVRSYAKTAFPTHLVYGNVHRAELRLITCTNWNSVTKEYNNDAVVFARLV